MACDPRASLCAAALLAAGGCATQGAPVHSAPAQLTRLHIVPPPSVVVAAQAPAESHPAARAAPPKPVSPFLDSPVSFLIHGHFTRGELVIVRVCLRPDHSIASSDVIESSGDAQFDQMALTWAQRVRLRQSSSEGEPIARCGAVRVELHDATQPSVFGARDDQLG